MTRVILDEGVPKRLARKLRELGIDATAFPNEMKQLSNGALLAAFEQQGFSVLVTNDKKMQFQQNMARRKLAIVVLPTNIQIYVFAQLSEIAEAIGRVRPGEILQVASPNAARKSLSKDRQS